MAAVAEDLKRRSYTKVADWTRPELEQVLDLADELKRAQKAREEHRYVAPVPDARRPDDDS